MANNSRGTRAEVLCILPQRAEALELLGVFEEDGLCLTWVPGPREAIRHVGRTRFDLILADLPGDAPYAASLVRWVSRRLSSARWVLVDGGDGRCPPRLPARPARVHRPLDPARVRDAARAALQTRFPMSA
jgi:hypothetical protein